jgi:hypothetical protein
VQVTINVDLDKVLDTQGKFLDRGLEKTYQRLIFVALDTAQKTFKSRRIVLSKGSYSFKPTSDVKDLVDLLTVIIARGNPSEIQTFCARLDSEMLGKREEVQPSPAEPVIRLRRLFNAHMAKSLRIATALKPFGITPFTLANTEAFVMAVEEPLLKYVAEQFGVGPEWLDATDSYIYSGAKIEQHGALWRSDLWIAFDIIARAEAAGERLFLFVPAGPELVAREGQADCVDQTDSRFERFVLAAAKENDFGVDRYRVVVSDTFSYGKCRDGLFLLMLAASLYGASNQGTRGNVDVWTCRPDDMRAYGQGDRFIAELEQHGNFFRNNRDFFYPQGQGQMKATADVPLRVVNWLQDLLSRFAAKQGVSVPSKIVR